MSLEILRGLHLSENKSVNRLLKITAFCSTLLFTACSPKAQSYLFGANINLGPIPEDVCRVNDNPVILSVSTESEGDINLVYVRNNGDIVAQHYSRDLGGLGMKYAKVGEFYWTGGKCPSVSTSR